ncbi:MAG: CoB--CoM heterodisulfide reductase iron-sulfur subunit B family protein [Sulfurimonas sp.]|uniref:CoB--CoM heterodisulfide reductase iron-sulfur subunit B family protein n=1 Tax=Sulfurimonas sp. TaxID=2022749 RepID=UPI002628CBDF|nr:CoB--CoM heterodisulfide reductase iron-sulfur subunit B family protein [Sulfurimonas sp.]MDD2652935.1 CoB--CoM heterodisulfide reductase iron-sulfur subunit B family protein [Sulfurimonas sp.]MDD3452381.1 CoB--CoM heterodisulfide reductase iron-sulfur subunit B family protein [Sulfurimonas sp.]
MKKLKYALFTGCTAKQSTPEQMMSTMAVARKLNIEMIELTEASCCGASHLQDYDDFLSLVLNARNIAYAEKHGLTMVTICNTCQLNTAMTKHRLDKNPELKARVNEKLAEVGLEYKGTSNVIHFLYAIIDDFGLDEIKKMVVKPLSQFNIAPFYGCHNIRPSELHDESHKMRENPYKPTSLDDLIIACGGMTVDYEEKTKCCGFHVELQAPNTAAVLTGAAIAGATDSNADMMVTPCPLCHLKLDTQTKSASKAIGREVALPVLHMQQMVGLALGCSPEELGLKHHVTDVNFI